MQSKHPNRSTHSRQSMGAWAKKSGQMFVQSGKDFLTDNSPQWAAAIAYYSLLSMFPLLLGGAAIASFFVDQSWAINQANRLLSDFLPGRTDQIQDIVEQAIQARGSISILSILALLWSGSRMFGTITRAMNITFDVDETYGFLKRTLVEVLLLISVGGLFVIALASRYLLRFLMGRFQFFPGGEGFLFQIMLEVVPGILLLTTFFLIYLYVPRREVDWLAALLGAITATILFLIGRPLFVQYLREFANFNLIYGPIAAAIIFVFWSWIMAVFLLFGGEVASHTQAMLIEGKSADQVGQEHEVRSPTHKQTHGLAADLPEDRPSYPMAGDVLRAQATVLPRAMGFERDRLVLGPLGTILVAGGVIFSLLLSYFFGRTSGKE